MTDRLDRLPRRAIAISAVETLTTGIPTAATLYAAQSHWADVDSWVWRSLWAYLIYTRIWSTFVPYAGISYRWDDDRLVMVEGLLSKHEKHVMWADVAILRVTQPWPHRLLRCMHVSATSTGTHAARLTLPAVTPAEAQALEAAFHAQRDGQQQLDHTRPDASAPLGSGRTIFTMPTTGILLTGLTYGRFFLAIPLLLELAGQAHDAHLISHVPWTWQDLTGGRFDVWAGVLVCAVGIGTGISYARYGHFNVTARGETVTVTRGLVETSRSTHRAGDADGFLIRQNLIMQGTGHYRLDACSRATSSSEMSTTLLPCARWATVVALLAELGTPAPPAPPAGHPLARPMAAGICGTTIGCVGAACWTSSFTVRLGVVVAMVALAALVNSGLGSVVPPTDAHADRTVLRHRQLAPRWVITSTSEVQAIESVTGSMLPGEEHRLLTCHLHIGRPLGFRAFVTKDIATVMIEHVRSRSAASAKALPR